MTIYAIRRIDLTTLIDTKIKSTSTVMYYMLSQAIDTLIDMLYYKTQENTL